MIFLKHSITVLLALFILSLASSTITSKANAQEVKPQDFLRGNSGQACPMARFIVVGSAECKVTSRTNLSATPVSQFIPAAPKLNKPQDKPVSASVSLVQESYTPTATLSADLLFDLVNNHRKELELPPFEHDKDVCSVADSRREEMVREIFVTRLLHSGFYAKNLPYFATENLIWQHTEKGALNWWLNSPIHRAAIDGRYKYACGVCNGDVCDMIFTNYEKKIVAQVNLVQYDNGKRI